MGRVVAQPAHRLCRVRPLWTVAVVLPSHVPATGLYSPSGMHPTSWRTRVSSRSGPPLRPTAPSCGPVYRRRRPTQTPLYPLVRHHLETFLAQAAEADPMGGGVPRTVVANLHLNGRGPVEGEGGGIASVPAP